MVRDSIGSASSTKRCTLDLPSLYVLIDSVDFLQDANAPQLKRMVEKLIEAGVGMIQLRDKRLNDRQAVTVGRLIVTLTQATGTRFLMNDRTDLAVACAADGIHVGQEDLSVEDARSIVGPEKIIGISTHSLFQVREGIAAGADYIAVGPVFPSATKAFDAHVGTGLLAEVAKEGFAPTFAIGGINDSNVDQVIATGVRNIAVSSAVTRATDPYEAASKLLRKLRGD
jgi:thiamine-phosphate pyrophosphorylase